MARTLLQVFAAGARALRLVLLVSVFVCAGACGGTDAAAPDLSQPGADTATDAASGLPDVSSVPDAADDVPSPPDAVPDAADDADQAALPVEPHVEQRGAYTIVWLAGSPYEMGRQHGELLHDVIAEAMDFVRNDAVMSLLPAIARGMGILDVAEASSYPDLLEECEGLIDATADTGFTMDYCLTLNFGDVMLEFVEQGGVPAAAGGPGCSGVIATGAATPDGELRHTRNLDWGSMDISIIHQHPVLFVRQPTGAIPHVFVGFPMNLSPYTGMNLAGISIGSHEAEPASSAEQSPTGRSHVQMVGQLLKTARSLDDVRGFLAGEQHMSVEMLVVADGDGGTGAVFEMTAAAMGVREMSADGIVYATNHFVLPEMLAHHAPPFWGSTSRFQRFQQLVEPAGAESLWGRLDEAGLATVMRDTVDPVTGLAPTLEELEAADWDSDGTIGANGPMHLVVFAPVRRLFWVAAGQPPIHRQPYTCFSLEELLELPDARPCVPVEL